VKSKTIKNKTKEHVLTLRQAIFNVNGQDKDVTQNFTPFLAFKRNGLDLSVEFAVRPTTKMRNRLFKICKDNMEDTDDGWDDAEKRSELDQKPNRFLLIREQAAEGAKANPVIGYCNFRFSMQGELLDEMIGMPTLFVYDLQIASKIQHKGVGLHIMNLLQLIARKECMTFVSMLVPWGCVAMETFIEQKLKGFEEDELDYAEGDLDDYEDLEGLSVFHRCINPANMPAKVVKPAPKLVPAKTETETTPTVVATIEDEESGDDVDDEEEDGEVISTGEVDPSSTPVKQAPAPALAAAQTTPESTDVGAKPIPAETPAAAKQLFAAN